MSGIWYGKVNTIPAGKNHKMMHKYFNVLIKRVLKFPFVSWIVNFIGCIQYYQLLSIYNIYIYIQPILNGKIVYPSLQMVNFPVP